MANSDEIAAQTSRSGPPAPQTAMPEPSGPRPPGIFAVLVSFALLFATWLVIGLTIVMIAEALGYLPPPKVGPTISWCPVDSRKIANVA